MQQRLSSEDYVIVNIWTSEDNKALPGDNVGHVSLETRLGYISFWPGGRKERNVANSLPLVGKFLKQYFGTRPHEFKSTYESDCLAEALCEHHVRPIRQIIDCQPGEAPYILNEDEGTYRRVTEPPKGLDDSESLMAIKLSQAKVRLVLYGLQVDKLKSEFEGLKSNVKGWGMLGSNFITQTVLGQATTESCASLANRCLKAGGMNSKLQSKASSQTSSVVAPDILLRQVVAVKQEELKEHPYTKEFKCKSCENENTVEEIEAAYQRIGRSANANTDKIPLAECRIS